MSTLAPFLEGRTKRARFTVRPRALEPLPAVDGLLAGAAEVDITPPPGLPKAGYSANAHDGDGFRTRLRARVLHLRAGRVSLAIVQCDLLGGSAVLQHLIADAIADRTDIPLAGLMIGATHTHAGPGQFLGTDFYNRFASNRRGFDPKWTQFLVDRISSAAINAYESRRPAQLAIGTAPVFGLTRNRSLDPHVHNETVSDKREEPQRKFVNVNPDLHVVRVDGIDGSPIGATVIFSVHGTGISQHTREYNADVWGYLVAEMRERVAGSPVIGTIEGTHADVAPALRPGLAGHLEAARVGRGVGAHAAALYNELATELRDDIRLACAFREVDVARQPSIDGVTLPRRPAVGAALVAGAKENLTPVIHRVPPFRAGHPHRRFRETNPHAHKWVLGSRWLQPLVIPLRQFPHIIPVQVLRIGAHAIVGMPFEVTIESGRRMARAVGEPNVIVSSVANEYTGYVTTPEEYSRQYYEGGHTIYGPKTLAFLSAHAAHLATEAKPDAMHSSAQTERSFDLAVHRYWPPSDGARGERRFAAAPTFHDPTKIEDAFWEIEWTDVAPGDLEWHESMVQVEGADGRVVADDQWGAIDVTYLGGTPEGHRYRARWFNPQFGAGTHRFVLCPNGAQPRLASDPFD
ncbi:MAG TPA: neutral/alkaline non-lysosomal ceramidase N-terminal domain-containing protein [Acidimicrobiia bacterium]|nr:neutral/alkaline non-lysosomal ceramidase N-terminal domain-containing protein [Acidimicrobiia bacterium]